MRGLLTIALYVALTGLFLRPLFHSSAVRAGTAVRMDTVELTLGAELIIEGHVLSAEVVETDNGLLETN